jgi:hypothetical protein
MISQQQFLQSEGIELNDSQGLIRQLDVNIAHKTLGTYKCSIGRESDHAAFLKDKSDAMAYKTNQCHLNWRQAITAYRSCYILAILYSLSAVSLDQKKIDTIQQKAIMAFLRKSFYDMHFPRKVVYGTEKYGGLGYLQL